MVILNNNNRMGIMMKIIQIILYALFLAVVGLHATSSPEPDRHCLDCICKASTGCKKNVQCHNDGQGHYFCGPYQISWAYWSDGGKPGDAGFPNDFEKCLVSKSCSEATVRGYMAKYGNDCNGDGHVDCLDYAAIHKAGGGGSCQQSWLLESKYWQEFQQCYQNSPATHSTSSSSSSSSSSSYYSSSTSISSSSPSNPFRDNSQPSNSIIEIPRPSRPLSSPSSFALPPLLPPPPPLPPVHAHATASVPGISASAAASAGFEPESGRPITFARARTSDDYDTNNDDDNNNSGGLVEIHNYGPSPVPRRVPGRRPNLIPIQPAPFNNQPISSPLLVPTSANFQPSRIVFPGNNQPPAATGLIKPSDGQPSLSSSPVIEHVETNNGISSSGIVPQDCLECLCYASSKCDLNKGCDGAFCGPYLLSWGYWADGGQPGNEYAGCSKQKSCSELAIQGYMEKWQRDCNKDGKIDCIDFALIHKLGPHGCDKVQATEQTDYWNQFTECRSSPNSIKPVRSATSILVELPKPSLDSIFNNNADDSNDGRFIGPLPKPPSPTAPSRSIPNFENQPNNNVVIRVNNPNLREIPNPSYVSPENDDDDDDEPRAILDLSHLNRSRPIIIRIRPHGSNDANSVNTINIRPAPRNPIPPPPPPRPNNNFINNRPIIRPQPLPQPQPSRPDENEEVIVESRPINRKPASNIRDPNDNVDEDFFAQPRPSEQPNEPSNVFEIPRRSANLEDNRNAVQPPRPKPFFPQPSSTERPVRPQLQRQNSTSNELVSQECLECICYSASRCSNSIGCRSEGSGKYICGPYQVDWEYWSEAGKPGNRPDLSNLENFQMCLQNRECADQTVRAYIAKFRKDCNEDGTIDCNDYAALHVAGPNQCGAQWYLDSKYYSDFRECFDF